MERTKPQLLDSIEIKLHNLCALPNPCCIYKVPEKLRIINSEAYRPSVVSIGPFHYKDERLRAMEEYKLRYLKSFLDRADNHNLEDFVNVVKGREELVRQSYSEVLDLDSGTFIEMVLVDAAFIIELFLRKSRHELREENDRIFAIPHMIDELNDDMKLEENQLPFFIIRELYDFAFEPDGHGWPHFLSITGKFFEDELGVQRPEPKHFVDFLRARYLPLSRPPQPDKRDEQPSCFSVTHLHKAGVKIEATKESSLLAIKFDGGVLGIPKINLQDSTESIWRNLAVFEEHHYQEDSYIMDYLFLLDFLINDPRDIEFLVENGIVTHWLGNTEDVSDLFRNLTKQITINSSNFCYADLCQQLNAYCNSKCRKNKTILRQKYFNHPWAVLSVISAIVLLLLTVIQAITGVISVIHK
ncbi:hypothetical protein Ancab_000845 [Ancistrocladus abbreviatus]